MNIYDFYRNKLDNTEIVRITNFIRKVGVCQYSALVVATPVVIHNEGDESLERVMEDSHWSTYGTVEEIEDRYEFVGNDELIKSHFGSNDYYVDVVKWLRERNLNEE